MRNILALCLVSLLCCACDTNGVYDKYQEVAGSWDKDRKIQFEITDVDSTVTHNMFITLRTNYTYPYNNLFLITQLDFPNGRQLTDTLEYAMARPDGTLLGAGWSDVKEHRLWYREGVRFRESGTYTFSLRHAMRRNGSVAGDETLEGVIAVGTRIERQK